VIHFVSPRLKETSLRDINLKAGALLLQGVEHEDIYGALSWSFCYTYKKVKHQAENWFGLHRLTPSLLQYGIKNV